MAARRKPWFYCGSASSQTSSRLILTTAWELMATAWRGKSSPQRKVKRVTGEGKEKFGKTGRGGSANVFFIEGLSGSHLF